jgi:hypothetical protein
MIQRFSFRFLVGALAFAFVPVVGVAAPSFAQIPTPPSEYVAPAISRDELFLPLLTAAERDAAEGRPALAIARAEMISNAISADSSLRIRAEGVRLVARGQLSDPAPETPLLETVLEPLVQQAMLDARGGSHVVAIARLDFVISQAPPGTPLRLQAEALRQASAHLLVQPAPVVAPPPPVLVPGGASGLVLPFTPEAPVAPPPQDPTRRGTGELVELYITAAAFGVYTGFWIPFAAGLEGGSSAGGGGSAENIGYSLSMLAGGGLFALGVAGLDSGNGLRTGTAPAMSMGLRYGFASGFLLWGALDPVLSPVNNFICDPTCREIDSHPGFVERTALPFGLGLGGLLMGAVIGYGLEPGVPEVRFVETGGLWGTTIGFLLAIAAAEDSQQGFAITAGGLGLGLLSTAIIAGAGVRMSPRRSWLSTLGLVVGVGGGAAISGIASGAASEFDPTVFGTVTLVTGVAGLVTALVITQGMDDSTSASQAELDLRLDFAPALDGRGGTASLRGSF